VTDDGSFVGGTARINSAHHGAEASACAVLSYDYTVLAGTQGATGHRKKDRLVSYVASVPSAEASTASSSGRCLAWP